MIYNNWPFESTSIWDSPFFGFIRLLNVWRTSFPVPLIFVSAILIMKSTSSTLECGNQAKFIIIFDQINENYLDYLRHKEDNQVEFDCRQKLKEAGLQNFFLIFIKSHFPKNFRLKNVKITENLKFSALIKVPFIFLVFEETV